MSTWFLCKATYLRTDEEGKRKKVVEELLFDAVSVTDAEARLYEELGKNDSLQVLSVSKKKITDVLDDEVSMHWYSVRSVYTNVDDKDIKDLFLVRAGNIQEVLNNFYVQFSVNNHKIKEVKQTNILTVYTND